MKKRLRKEPAHCSSLGLIMQCAAATSIKEKAGDFDNVYSVFGTAYHDAMNSVNTSEIINYDLIQKQYALSDAEIEEMQKMVRRVPLDMSEWQLHAEQRLYLDEDMKPSDAEHAILTGKIDLRAVHAVIPGLMLVVDYKSGFLEVDDWQNLGYSLLIFANFPEAEFVLPMYYYSKFGGRLVQREDKDHNALPYTRADIQRIWPTVRDRCLEAMGKKPTFKIGPRCGNCAAYACPAWAAWRDSLLTDSNSALTSKPNGELTPLDWVRFVLPRLKVAEDALASLREQVKCVVRTHGAVDLGDGTILDNRPQTVTKIDVAKAWPLLSQFTDGNVAPLLNAVETMSKDDLNNFVKQVFEKTRGKKAEILAALEELGALRFSSKESIKVYPKQQLIEEEES